MPLCSLLHTAIVEVHSIDVTRRRRSRDEGERDAKNFISIICQLWKHHREDHFVSFKERGVVSGARIRASHLQKHKGFRKDKYYNLYNRRHCRYSKAVQHPPPFASSLSEGLKKSGATAW